jgi:SAM-dependent methyltransferase
MHQKEFEIRPFPFLDRQIGDLNCTENLFFNCDARIAHQVLQMCLKSNLIYMSHIGGKILDFGCGFGGSTAVLGTYEGDVTCIDLMKYQHYLAKAMANTIISGDGVDYLKKLPANSLDLITAFMIGPESQYHGICKDFYLAAQQALKPDGRILVTSDYETIAALSKIAPTGYGSYLNCKVCKDYNGEIFESDQPTFVGIKSPFDLGNNSSLPTISNLGLLEFQDDDIKEAVEYFRARLV